MGPRHMKKINGASSLETKFEPAACSAIGLGGVVRSYWQSGCEDPAAINRAGNTRLLVHEPDAYSERFCEKYML
jgi:hypothetical protein